MKPLMIFQSPITKRWYATKAYKEMDEGKFVCTGKKEDITDQIETIIEQAKKPKETG